MRLLPYSQVESCLHSCIGTLAVFLLLSCVNPDEMVQYYTYGRFEDLIILKDGTCSVDLSKYKLPEGSAFSKNIYSGDIFWRGKYYYVGFEDMDTMFHRCVTENMEKYEYESDVTGE